MSAPTHFAIFPVVIPGSTGSIGAQASEIICSYPGRFDVHALATGGGRIELLARQVLEFGPQLVTLASLGAQELINVLKTLGPEARIPEILEGEEGIAQTANLVPSGIVLNGITGGAGLAPTLAALQSGATLALTNKESLVMGGHLVRSACVRPGQIVLVDSEHSAITQAFASGMHEKELTSPLLTGKSEVTDLVLTTSGDLFRDRTRQELHDVTPAQVFPHPTWDMEPVVTVDSSTLANKGLELIEMYLLFDVAPEHVFTIVYPQSIVHSMVTWIDGATTLQASPLDMCLPIALGLSWPKRLEKVGELLIWSKSQFWTFGAIDETVSPAVSLVYSAVVTSAIHPVVLNAANKAFVDTFISEYLPWLGIVGALRDVAGAHEGTANPLLKDIIEVQEWAGTRAEEAMT